MSWQNIIHNKMRSFLTSPGVNGKTSLSYDGHVMEDVEVQGRNEVHFANTQDLIQSGRSINKLDVDNRNQVCLIGHDVLSELFPVGNPIDK